MSKVKKMVSLLIGVIMIWVGSGVNVVALESPREVNGLSDDIIDIIMEQALQSDSQPRTNIDKSIVPIQSTYTTLSSVNEFAIQKIEQQNDIILQTTIIPYKVNLQGELVTSFVYAATNGTARDSSLVTSNFVDVTVTTIAKFARYFTGDRAYIFYRHAGVEASWSAISSDVIVDNLQAQFTSVGQLYSYPECVNDPDNLEDYFIESGYSISSTIDKDFPIENRVYADNSNSMYYDEVLLPGGTIEEGGTMFLSINYSVDGSSFDRQSRVYIVYNQITTPTT